MQAQSESLRDIADRAAAAAVAVDEMRILGEFTDGAQRVLALLVELKAAAQWLGTFGHVLAIKGRLGYCETHRCVFSTVACGICAAVPR